MILLFHAPSELSRVECFRFGDGPGDHRGVFADLPIVDVEGVCVRIKYTKLLSIDISPLIKTLLKPNAIES